MTLLTTKFQGRLAPLSGISTRSAHVASNRGGWCCWTPYEFTRQKTSTQAYGAIPSVATCTPFTLLFVSDVFKYLLISLKSRFLDIYKYLWIAWLQKTSQRKTHISTNRTWQRFTGAHHVQGDYEAGLASFTLSNSSFLQVLPKLTNTGIDFVISINIYGCQLLGWEIVPINKVPRIFLHDLSKL